MDKILHDLKNYGIFLIMGNAGFCPSTVVTRRIETLSEQKTELAMEKAELENVCNSNYPLRVERTQS